MDDDELIKLSLTNCIVHLLEHMREGGRGLDLIAAQTSLMNYQTQGYLEGLDTALMPLPRDNAKYFDFPAIGE